MFRSWPSHRSRTAILLLLFAGAFAACSDSAPPAPDDNPIDPGDPVDPVDPNALNITIDNTVTLQRIDGFGANTLPLVYGPNDYLGALRPNAVQTAFGSVGISLTQLNIGLVEAPANVSDPFAARGNDNNDPNVMNPAGFVFTGSDIARERVWNLAQPFGLTGVDLGPLIDLRFALNWMQSLRSSDYSRYIDEVGEHVLAIVQRWRNTYGLTPRYLHLFNEPTSGGAELVSTNTQEVVDIVKRAGQRLAGAGFSSVKFVVPNEETVTRSLTVARAILQDAAARPFVGAIGYHPYPYGSAYSSPRRILEASGAGAPDIAARQQMEELKALGQQYGVPVWMTEVSEGPGTLDYELDAIEPVLARAIHIRDNFEFAGASAFFGMNTIWDSQSHAEHFVGRNVAFLTEASSIVLVQLGSGSMIITPMGRAIGHYARSVKPGARRIAAASSEARVIVTAFRDAGASKITVVVVNTGTSARPLRFVLTGASATGSVTGEASYGAVRWQPMTAFAPAAANDVRTTVQPMSVTTIVIPIR